MGELVVQTRLPDAGLADHGDDLPMPGLRAVERVGQLLNLAGPPDECRQAARGRRREPRPDGGGAEHLVHLDRLGHALHRRRTDGSDVDVALGQGQRVSREQGCPRIGELFHARGQVRGLRYRRIVHAQVAADGPHDHFAGIQADADPDRDAVVPSHVVRVPLHRALHGQGGVAAPHRVVLMGEGRAEQGHDSVAHHLVDRALVAVHGVHHVVEHRVEDLPGFLGIAVGQELHRALEIGEEDRHLLPFTFERALGGEDPLGEVLGGIGVWREEAGRLGWFQRSRTLSAEFVAGRIGRPARRADGLERRRALPAEAHAHRVLSLAPKTFHGAASGKSGRSR